MSGDLQVRAGSLPHGRVWGETAPVGLPANPVWVHDVAKAAVEDVAYGNNRRARRRSRRRVTAALFDAATPLPRNNDVPEAADSVVLIDAPTCAECARGFQPRRQATGVLHSNGRLTFSVASRFAKGMGFRMPFTVCLTAPFC